ncbi:macrophage erythroblast attacher-like [Paramuricea clavata]|uniref:E3 ubiquitin-protein transferase MAEA n=1 Tax=Paramuricea clavata TaxID=317549 RepID=A0A7D9HQ62_PARCT|nr:macrophage erythroblast attacher-like [Paramuricea clavata]
MADVKTLEYSTLKVPYEVLNKKFRTAQKIIDREVSHVLAANSDLSNVVKKQSVKVSDMTGILDGVIEKLQVLKRKAEECVVAEEKCTKHLHVRLEHLKEHADERKSSMLVWKKKRLDRMLVDHLLRAGYYETAGRLAADAQIEELVDVDLFVTANRVEKALEDHNAAPCLTWCHEHKSRLRKLKSTLEFNVRTQEFIEFIRANERQEAVRYARKHFGSVDVVPPEELRKIMALLAFTPETVCDRYKDLFNVNRWDDLAKQFKRDNFALHHLSSESTLSVTLQTGLSALKTPHCGIEGHTSSECPVCSKQLSELATTLPYSHCAQSRLVCPISGEVMNENNPPMVLPNGYVYGENSLQRMAQNNNGVVTCVKTKEQFKVDEAEKVFVM